MFCKKISLKISICFHKIDIFVPKLKLTETIVDLPESLYDIILSLYLEIHSFAQKLTLFCIKCYSLLKENNATKNWHFSKTEDISLRKLNISIKNEHYWKWWPFATKKKKTFKIGVSARFLLLPVKHT